MSTATSFGGMETLVLPQAAISTAEMTEFGASFPELCEELFIELAENDPMKLLRLIQTTLTSRPELLTFAAEAVGRIPATSVVVKTLLPLLSNSLAFVREGAIYGLIPHLEQSIDAREALRSLTQRDTSPGVLKAAADALALLE